MTQTFPVRRPYPWKWLVLFAAIGALFVYGMFFSPQIPQFDSRERSALFGGRQTYYLIHMPAVPNGQDFMVSKAEAWLVGMATKGFHPLLLSEVHRRLQANEGLPGKTVVLMFDPGTTYTFEVMAPLLAKYKYPAVWVTNVNAMSRHDRQYVSYHVMHAMEKSGIWDVAHYEGSRLVIHSPKAKDIVIGQSKGTWRENSGRRALNRGVPEDRLNRLHVNWNWTEQQMVDRLQAEEPLQINGFLTLKNISGHNWGIIMPVTSAANPGFSLKAPMEGRTANLSWLGTRGIKDAQFRLNVQSLSGEMWLMMRSDEEVGESVGVCFGNGVLTVGQARDHQFRPIATYPIESLRQPTSFLARISLNGPNLVVTVNGVQAARLNSLTPPQSDEGIVRMLVYDKIMGGAQVESVKLEMERQGNIISGERP